MLGASETVLDLADPSQLRRSESAADGPQRAPASGPERGDCVHRSGASPRAFSLGGIRHGGCRPARAAVWVGVGDPPAAAGGSRAGRIVRPPRAKSTRPSRVGGRHRARPQPAGEARRQALSRAGLSSALRSGLPARRAQPLPARASALRRAPRAARRRCAGRPDGRRRLLPLGPQILPAETGGGGVWNHFQYSCPI